MGASVSTRVPGWLAATGVALALLLGIVPAMPAQTVQSQPLRMLVPFPPGGTTDIIARAVSHEMAKDLGHPVIVENRPGAAGLIGTAEAARAPADGNTLLIGGTTTLVTAPLMNPAAKYDPLRDLRPVSLLAMADNLIVVNADLPVRSLHELVAYAKANPGKLSFASPGQGSLLHLAGELLRTTTGIQMTHVPYKGAAAAEADLVGGHVSMMVTNMGSVLPHVRSGKVRALAIASPGRSSELPEVPTTEEAGLPGYEVVVWGAVFVPAKTPPAAVARLNAAIVRATQSTALRDMFARQGMRAASSTPEEMTRILRADIRRWEAVIKDSRITLE